MHVHENNYNNLDAKNMRIFVSTHIFIEKYGVRKICGGANYTNKFCICDDRQYLTKMTF